MKQFLRKFIQKNSTVYAAGLILLVILSILSVCAGTKALSSKDSLQTVLHMITNSDTPLGSAVIIQKIRIPRTLAALFCGAALAVSGLVLQGSLNNTLASPGIIGINSGAGLFVLLVNLFFPYAAVVRSAAAFCGALASVFGVYLISIKAGISKTTLVLAGVAVSSMMTAGIDVLMTLHPEIVTDKVAFSLGGFQNLSISSLKTGIPVIIAGIAAALVLSGGIDLFQLGDEAAFGLGLNVKLCRILSIGVSGILAGAAVSISGLLGFVGLIIPNLVRLFSKGSTRKNILLSAVFGADFLLLCDLLARVLFFPYELPVGLFLSCLGSPFFIWILVKRKRKLDV